jgi:hypothetical protein
MSELPPEIYTVRKSWISAVKRGEFKLEREHRDFFASPPLLFNSFEAAKAAARKLATAEAAEDEQIPLYGWIIGDPIDMNTLTIFEVVPVAVELNAQTSGKGVDLAETFDGPVEDLIPFDGEVRSSPTSSGNTR